jgi:HSP20 family protein
MDSFSKKLLAELREMEQTGRMLRNMSAAGMMPYKSGGWEPAVDVYEGETELYMYVDLAGVDKQALELVAEERQVRIKGVRQLPGHGSIACIHQLEIELGSFDRTVALPGPVMVDGVTSVYKNGFLIITLPKRQHRGKVQITIHPRD